MRPSRRAQASTPKLQQVWTRTVVTVLLLAFGLGLLSFGATQYQRAESRPTTSGPRAETTALASLEHVLDEAKDAPTMAILYGEANAFLTHRVTYSQIHGGVNCAVIRAAQALSTAPEREALGQARQTWLALDRTVTTAQTSVSGNAPLKSVASGRDPYQDLVWDRLNTTVAEVGDVGQLSAAQLAQRTAGARRGERLIAPLIVAAIVLAFLCWFAARRMTRLALAPIVMLRGAAMAIGSGTAGRPINLPGAPAEFQDLAATLNERAASHFVSTRHPRHDRVSR
jgi:hypothetical protein